MKWSIERVVAILAPVFVALSGAISTGVARLVPGLNIPAGDLTAIFIAGSTLGGTALLTWLHGRQKFVQFETDTDKVVARFGAVVKANAPLSLALGDIEGILKAHTNQIVEAVGAAAHAPPSVDQVVEAMVAKLAAAPPAASSVAPAVVTQTLPPPTTSLLATEPTA